jgi:hypothetical protein
LAVFLSEALQNLSVALGLERLRGSLFGSLP